MAWYITDGVLQKAVAAPAANSILTNITGSGNVIIPEGVTSIGNEAFWRCSALTSINIPNSVTSIGNQAFYNCDSLTSINIPNSVTSIGNYAFSSCKSLTRINIPENHPVFYVENNLLISKEGTLIWCPMNALKVIIPDSVTSIGDSAFPGCESLTSITIPNSVTSIGYQAFRCCEKLTSINIPNSVTSIGDEAFSWCKSLTSINIPTGLLAQLDKETLKSVQTISCPISLKDAPANVRLKLCIGFALHQDNYSDDLRTEYLAHIKKNAAKLVGAAFDYPELLYLMCREKLIPAKSIDAFTEEAAKRENVELTAAILDYQNTIGMAEVSKARDRKEKIRQQQDEVIIDRMAARADKVGIDGLNFVVTGGLNHFTKRDDLKAYIIERGGKLMSAMSAKTDYLITNDTDSGSIKNKKAAELGIIVITEDEFLKMAEAHQ